MKGYGGSLVRERIVAAAARRLVILAEPSKLVGALGERGVLPVEVAAFGWAFCARRLEELGCRPRRRMVGAAPFVSDNGNYVLDCGVGPIPDPAGLERSLDAIPGVVGTGLFLGMSDTVLLEDEQGPLRGASRAEEVRQEETAGACR